MTSFAISLALFACTVIAFQLDFKVQKQEFQPHAPTILDQRDFHLLFRVLQNVYITELEIGSNNDKVSVSIDTGSSSLWVMSSSVECLNVSQFHTENAPTIPKVLDDLYPNYTCTANGTYNPNESETFVETNQVFNIGYADGTGSSGYWGLDDLHIGNATVHNFKFGIANITSVDVGIMGIGWQESDDDNFPKMLEKQGITNSSIYSIYMTNETGVVLFGDVDNSKYTGEMATTNMTKAGTLEIESLMLDDEKISVVGTEKVLFDTGATFSAFPREWIEAIAEAIGGRYNTNASVYDIGCDEEYDQMLKFTINGTELSFPLTALVSHVSSTSEETCVLAILDQSIIGGVLFGSDILQNFYTVYDFENDRLSIAQLGEDVNADQQSSSISNEGASKTNEAHSVLPWSYLEIFLVSVFLFVL
ncbi:BAR1 [Candida oxycetoniae]|uniref:BAR1 n=1 Tax=Candida oxycetoniae TaxID=497107 RepID=A0AAI9SVK1_9ASCO|nr:BAR1 [Candida oxycetoniae]KAI3403524.2 BAR1 [Candida oxycetoniae]